MFRNRPYIMLEIGFSATCLIFWRPVGLMSCTVCGAAILLYWYLTSTHTYWADKGVPGPKPIAFFGTYLGQFFYSFHISEEERMARYGKIYGIYEGRKPGLIVGDPKLIKDIMMKDTHIFINRRQVKTTHPVMANFLSSLEDSKWRRVRRIVRGTFMPNSLKRIYGSFAASAGPLLDTLESAAENTTDVDLKDLFGAYTMDVISRSCFATIPDGEFVRNASELFVFPFWRKFLDYVFPKWFLDIVCRFTVLPPVAMEYFRRITCQVIGHREAQGETAVHADYLQLLMDAEDGGGDARSSLGCSEHGLTDAGKKGDKLSRTEILSQSVLFFSVGFETSSQLLTYCGYCLALGQDIQDHLRLKILEMLSEHDLEANAEIPFELLDRCEYLEAVVSETLRLYNPVLRMERLANEDYKLGDTGITIPKGMIVGIPVWALHHSPDQYPDPEIFDPNRFMGSTNTAGKNYVKDFPVPFLPFGAGPRNCIGTRFAMMETKLALIKILRKFKFVPTENTKVPLKFFPTGRPLLGCHKVIVGIKKVEHTTELPF